MTVVSADPAPESAEGGGEGKGLKVGALGLLSTTVVAISSVAPAYSLAAALFFIVGDVGFHAPAIVLLAFVPMVLIAQGYNRLNREMPDCGTTFTWGAKAFGPKTGWMGGWAIVVADVIVMANLAAVAGQYMFQLFGANGLAASTFWTTFAGVGWIVVMCAICYIGIEISANIQYALLGIEIVMLGILSVVALAKVYGGSAPAADPADIKAKVAGAGPHHFHIGWFNPFGVGSLSALTIGLLTTIFIYWGWDTAVSINEECKDADKTPGRAALLATVVLLVTYTLVAVATTSFAGLGLHGIGLGNSDNQYDVLSVLGGSVFGVHGFGHVLAKLLVFMVLTSAMASTLTTILPTARTTLSMAVYRAIPARFARIHPRYLTPTWSTVGMGVISIAFYVILTVASPNVLSDLISALGLPIAFYYAMTGYECVWWYRKRLTDNLRTFLSAGVAPGLGALILTFFFGYGCYYYWQAGNSTTSWKLPFSPHWQIGGIFFSGILSLALGFVLIAIYRRIAPAYFDGVTLNASTPILVPEGDTVSVAVAAELAEEAIAQELAGEEAPS